MGGGGGETLFAVYSIKQIAIALALWIYIALYVLAHSSNRRVPFLVYCLSSLGGHLCINSDPSARQALLE